MQIPSQQENAFISITQFQNQIHMLSKKARNVMLNNMVNQVLHTQNNIMMDVHKHDTFRSLLYGDTLCKICSLQYAVFYLMQEENIIMKGGDWKH